MRRNSTSVTRAAKRSIVGEMPRRGKTLFYSSRMVGIVALMLVLSVCMLNSNTARAQQWKPWKTTTPRDTILVHANQENPWTSTSYTPDCISTEFYFSGTFGVFAGKDSTEFDARYMFRDPSWPAPFPLANPPAWNGTNYQVYLEVTNDLNLSDADSVHVLEGYQANHQYTAIYPGAGTFFEFRIYDQLNTQPNGSDYRLATGGITVRSAQYTAGISIKTNTLAFPTTNVGSSSVLLDSIASYGIDPLQIDSVWIVGPQASSFNVISQFGTHFTLNTASTNQFAVTYTPSTPEITSKAWLILRSPNADCPHRLDTILITGFSAAPNGTIGPSSIDFGLVRSGTSSSPKDAIASNSGNATYFITRDTIIPAPGTPAGVFTTTLVTVPPDPIYPGSEGEIQFNFKPVAAKTYQATASIWDSEGKLTKIILNGIGAAPHVTASDTALDFDTVFTNATKVLYDTITNSGNWTAHVIIAELGCTNPNWFSFDPPDSNFYLDAGQSRIYTISFRPATTINTSLNACLEFYFDDGSQPEVIPLTGYEKQRTIVYDTTIVDFGHIKIGDVGKQSVGVQNQSSRAANFNYSFDTASPVFQLIGTDSTTFNVGDTDKLQLQFQPTVHGPASAKIHIVCGTGQTDSIYMFGFGALAQPVFTPDTINFGTCLDTTQNYFQIGVSDTGDYPLDICSLDIVGPDSSEFSLIRPPTFPYTVPDSGLGALTLGFNFTTNSHTGGVHRATLQIHYCDGSMDTLPMEGTEATASIQFTRAYPIDFGNVRVNHTRDTGVGFVNPENIAEPIDTIKVISAGPFFTKDTTASVPASSYYYDSLLFAPTLRGHYTGWLYAGGGGMVDDSIQITGNGVQSIPVLSTHTINFAKTTLLQTSAPMKLTLQDTGDWPLVTEIEKINDPDSEFMVLMVNSGTTVDTVADDTVAISSFSTYIVTFTPRFPELPDHKSELVFHYDEGSPNDTVVLIGQDISNFLAFDRDTINFGRVRVGTLSPTLSLGLLNTSGATLTASTITGPVNQTGPTNQFSVTPNAPITVNSYDSAALQVSFTPTAIGVAQSVIAGVGSSFNTSLRDSVVLIGLGSEPAPKLSVDTLFFDTVAWGRVITRNFTLADTGNWPLVVTCGAVTGPNAADFIPTPAIPLDTTIDADSMATYPVTFTATTPLQLTPRVGYLTWTQDNGDTFQLVLIANDVPPLPIQVGFPHPYWGRPGDKIAAELDLQTAIPDTLGINHIHGTVTWDPTIVFIPPGGGPTAGSMVAGWTTVITTPLGSNGGIFNYDISSDTGVLTTPGALLNLMFQLQMNLEEGARTPLLGFDTIPNNPEVIVSNVSTTIFLDSICGTIHLLDGTEPIASFIEQNIPNPLGAGASSTTLPFDVGSNNTLVTIRLLDPTGREVLRPVDRQAFAQGRYQVTIDASSLHSGIYFYEFQVDGQPPQMLKMAVE